MNCKELCYCRASKTRPKDLEQEAVRYLHVGLLRACWLRHLPAAAGQTLVENVLIVPPVFPWILRRARSHPVPAASTALTDQVAEGSSIHSMRRPYRLNHRAVGSC